MRVRCMKPDQALKNSTDRSMKKKLFGILLAFAMGILMSESIKAQTKLDSLLPVRGFCIDAPRPAGLDSFLSLLT